jgi:hypothetical protein
LQNAPACLRLLWPAAICLSLASISAGAVDFGLTGYATLGGAISDEEFRYLRYIDDQGTLKTDSIAGVQLETRFTPQWGATVQAAVSAPRYRDEGVQGAVRWAFLSFRPTNDWLFRVGRLRPPVFIHTQSAEVGVTYDFARLPAEVYSTSPVYDLDGVAVTKTWNLGSGDLSADAYWGRTKLSFRLPQRPSAVIPGTSDNKYVPEKIASTGLMLSYSSGAMLVRGGVHQATVDLAAPAPATASQVPIPLPPPLGGALFTPVDLVNKFDVTLYTLGVDWRHGPLRLTAEYARRDGKGADFAPESSSAYASAAWSVSRWTPYIMYARLLSDSSVRGKNEQIAATPVPLAAGLPPNFHLALARGFIVYDQYSVMLGTSYRISPTSKVKAEWMRTHVGLASGLVDGDVQNKSFNVFSLSYSVVF